MHGNRLSVVLLWVTLVVLGGCGGGGGGGDGGSDFAPTGRGIEGSGRAMTSSGVVTAKGSIFVNGVEWEVGAAAITIDGDAASEADLGVGQIVIVEGELDEESVAGTAERVTIGIAVAGPISAVSLPVQQITVLGQVVEIDPITVIEPSAPDQLLGGLMTGDDIEISGFVNSAGLISARRITMRQPGTPLKVIGFASDLDAAAQRFSINGQAVDYSAASLVGLSADELETAPVRVTGSVLDTDGVLMADEVMLRDLRLPGGEGDAATLQGWVTRFTSASDFAVDGHPVVTTTATRLEGATDEQLGRVRLDSFVSVTGTLIADGVVEAALIETSTVIALDTVIRTLQPQWVEAQLVPWAGPGCDVVPETAISIDGLPGAVDQLEVGDVATIYANVYGDITQGTNGATCQIIAVEHNVRGPIEAKAVDSAWMTVMGQRVWFDSAYPDQGFAGLEALEIGDLVEVSGHTTAAGDILASGIHIDAGRPGHQVIGFARDVDGSRFTLGELLIDYSEATVGGFANDVPVEGERVLVAAIAPPSDGLLRADLVRFAGAVPRGAYANFLMPVGLITRLADFDDLDVEGRRLFALDRQLGTGVWRAGQCDNSKLHLDLRADFFSVGNAPGLPPGYWTAQCPLGRVHDDRGPTYFGSENTFEVYGPVDAIDLVRRVVTVAGEEFMLQPATLLTRFEASPALDGTGVTTPATLEEIGIGERVWVKVGSNPAAGIRVVKSIWLDDAVQELPENFLRAELVAVEGDELILYGDVRVSVTDDTVIFGDCEVDRYTLAEFSANVPAGTPIEISIVRIGDQLVAERVIWDPVCPREI